MENIAINPAAKDCFLQNKHIDKLKIDAVFPIIHGNYGEDGSLQGLLEQLDLPYVGCDVVSSALCIDKNITKKILHYDNIPYVKYQPIKNQPPFPSFQILQKQLGTSKIFLKPNRLGSSVGNTLCHNDSDLQRALSEIFQIDSLALAETYIEGRELEISVLGNENPQVSPIGEIITKNYEFYSYEAKYTSTENDVQLIIGTSLPKTIEKTIQDYAKQIFIALQCSGMARIDFFLDAKENIYCNEVNTLPGFTSISMYPKLWEKGGLPYSQLIEKLLVLALEKYQQKNRYLQKISAF